MQIIVFFIAVNEGQVNIISTVEAIMKVEVYDILGREIYTKSNINSTELSIKDLILNSSILVVKILLEMDKKLLKKIIL